MPSNTRAVAVALATVLLLAPVVGAASVQSNGFVALEGDSTDAAPTPASATSATQAGDGNANGSDTNYTRLYVEDEYRRLDLKPGESETFEVTVENGEDDPVELAPGLFLPKVGDRPVEEGWVSIEPGQTTLDAGAETTVTVTVNVPEDAELGEYRGAVQFTDETIQYPGRPPRPVHAATFNVEVQRDPTVFVLPLNRGYTQLEAGESYTHSVRINNTGEEAVPLDPTLQLRGERRPGPGSESSADRSWFNVDSPSQVPAGGSATVDVTVDVPEDASRGDYGAELNLGLRDPARNERHDHWQRMHMRFQVWKQPEEPFQKTFDVSEGTESVTVKLSAGDRRNANDEPAKFDVTLVGPDGETVDPERVETTNRGHVDLSGDDRRPRYRYAAEGAADSGSAYADEGGERVLRYRVDSPEDGEWTLQVMPEDTVRFRYEIIRDESDG
ncbi:MAG: hypothetical protein V5A62_11090 [Haloarculaceae archaeon]